MIRQGQAWFDITITRYKFHSLHPVFQIVEKTR